MKTLAETLKELRDERGLLLRQVAAALEVDTALISKFEKGERKPNRNQVIQLATFLKVDADTLLIQFLSDKVVYELGEEELANEALKVAEEKINYLKGNRD